MPPFDWAITVVLLKFFGGGEYGFSTAGISTYLGNRCGIQVQNYVALATSGEWNDSKVSLLELDFMCML